MAWRSPQGMLTEAGPLKSYRTGCLLPGERKSVEPMAARLAPENVRTAHQSPHHLSADAPRMDGPLLAEVRSRVLPSMRQQGPACRSPGPTTSSGDAKRVSPS
jgi:SRSO17 transposase